MFRVTVTLADQTTCSWYRSTPPTYDNVVDRLITDRIRGRIVMVEAVHLANGNRYRLDNERDDIFLYNPDFSDVDWAI